MNSNTLHSYFNMPLSEWTAATREELDNDTVGLWEIIPDLRKGFGLTGDALDRAVRDTLNGLLARGARPVIGSPAKSRKWERARGYGDNPTTIVDQVIAEWHAMGRDPDVGDLWFALPRFYANRSEC